VKHTVQQPSFQCPVELLPVFFDEQANLLNMRMWRASFISDDLPRFRDLPIFARPRPNRSNLFSMSRCVRASIFSRLRLFLSLSSNVIGFTVGV
jgi:hypothetical protein